MHGTGPHQALGFAFSVEVDDPALADYLRDVLGHLVYDEGPVHRYTLTETGGRPDRFALALDGAPLFSTEAPGVALARLMWHINRAAVDASSDLVLLHAGWATVGDRALVLPGPAGAGKSTLAGGLIGAGLRYGSDEIAAFTTDRKIVRPYPKPLALDAWSPLTGLLDRPPPAVDRYLTGQRWVDPRALGPQPVASEAIPAWVVLPRYERGSRGDLVRLGPGEGLLALFQNRFDGGTANATAFEVLAEVARRASCFSLVFGDLAGAVDLLCAAVGTEAPGPVESAREPPPVPDDLVPAPRPGVRAEQVDGQLVLLAPESANLHLLNQPASAVWERCDGRATIGQIRADLVERFGPVPRGDLDLLVAELRAKGLLG